MPTYLFEPHTDQGANAGLADGRDGLGDLLLEVDFKWLMAGQGCWIDPDRLHQEPGYALDCVRTAINSPCDALRRCAHALQAVLLPQAG